MSAYTNKRSQRQLVMPRVWAVVMTWLWRLRTPANDRPGTPFNTHSVSPCESRRLQGRGMTIVERPRPFAKINCQHCNPYIAEPNFPEIFYGRATNEKGVQSGAQIPIVRLRWPTNSQWVDLVVVKQSKEGMEELKPWPLPDWWLTLKMPE